MSPTTDRSVIGVVLAGAHAWGEAPLERLLPRPLLPVAGSPLIAYGLKALRDSGITDITICANSDTRNIRRSLGEGAGFGLNLSYYEDQFPRGPGGCLRDAVADSTADHVVVAESSAIPLLAIRPIVEMHRSSGAAATVVVQGGEPQSQQHLAPTGIYVFDRVATESISPVGYQDIKEQVIPQLVARGQRVAFQRAATWVPRVSSVHKYLAANEWVLRQLLATDGALPGYRRLGQSMIHASAEVSPAAVLVGPAMIGPYSRIATGAVLTGPVVVGAACEIEGGAVVSQSVLWDGCRVGSAAELDRCVLVSGALVNEGTTTSGQVISAHATSYVRPSPSSSAERPSGRLGSTPSAGQRKGQEASEVPFRGSEACPT